MPVSHLSLLVESLPSLQVPGSAYRRAVKTDSGARVVSDSEAMAARIPGLMHASASDQWVRDRMAPAE